MKKLTQEQAYYFYYVKLFNKTTKVTYWEVGIEKHLKSRWRTGKYFECDYLLSVKGDLGYCFSLEQELKEAHDTGVSKLDWPYGGRTEMLPYNFLEDV